METQNLQPYRPRRDFAGMEQRRLAAAKLFKQGVAQAEVARQLGVSRQAASVWFAAWKRRGNKGLAAAGRAGRKPRLTVSQLQKVERALLKGPRAHGLDADLWSLPRIAEVIVRQTGVRYHPGHVWRVMRDLGWSAQKPQPKARERDEAAIHHWKTRSWPNIKKKPAATGRS
ncbi:MAG TPA: winged helix-turn-helix domain-containing protein [bacterium]|nr:winged helix-turn-helix domain-containing protein [bacterium]